MDDPSTIINRVSASTLVTFNLEDHYQPGDRVCIDIAPQLYQGLVLKEKDFRAYVKQHDWSVYRNKFVAVGCSVDAIVPTWAFMLVAIALRPHASRTVFGDLERLEEILFFDALAAIDWRIFEGAKVVVKGCSKVNVPLSVYVETVNRLTPIAASIMFGEPCSTVPLYKKTKSE